MDQPHTTVDARTQTAAVAFALLHENPSHHEILIYCKQHARMRVSKQRKPFLSTPPGMEKIRRGIYCNCASRSTSTSFLGTDVP